MSAFDDTHEELAVIWRRALARRPEPAAASGPTAAGPGVGSPSTSLVDPPSPGEVDR